MANEKNAASNHDEPPKDVERVRDIIFGPQMREYDQRFLTVQRDIDRLRQELEQLNEQLGELDREHGRRVQNLRRESRQADDDLRNELRQSTQRLMFEKVDRLALGDLLIEMGNHLKNGGLLGDTLGLLTDQKE
jgi:septal ring factor EnvC (AmiA/AmiB activator)